MNKNNLVKIIGRELVILTDFVNGFAETETIHPIEVDLALSKTKDIYNELLLLKGDVPVTKLVVPISDDVEMHVAEAKMPEKQKNTTPTFVERKMVLPEAEVPKHVEIVEESGPEPTIELLPIVEINDEEHSEVLIESTTEVIPANEPEQTHHNEPAIPVIDIEKMSKVVGDLISSPKLPDGILGINSKKTSDKVDEKAEKHIAETIADKFSKDLFSINDKLASLKSETDLGSKLKANPITDLKKAIKLNDRVMFTKELFNKNSATFENAVEKINSASDLDSALKYLLENFKWNQDTPTTQSFLELVFRRFSSK